MRERYERIVKVKRGDDIFEFLETLSWDQCKTNLRDVEIFLKQKLKELKGIR